MPGTIRLFIGLTLLFCAASVNDTLPDAEFFAYVLAFAIPGTLIGFSGAVAANRAEKD